jgi:hypothetical protein
MTARTPKTYTKNELYLLYGSSGIPILLVHTVFYMLWRA